jgi:hypothetical protein
LQAFGQDGGDVSLDLGQCKIQLTFAAVDIVRNKVMSATRS